METSTIRVFLIDDEAAVRRGIRLMLALEPDIVVSGESGDASTAFALVGEIQPDVVVLDIELPGIDGIVLADLFRKATPPVPVVIHSLHDDEKTQAVAFAAGISDFVSKSSADGELVASIRRAARPAPTLQGDLR